MVGQRSDDRAQSPPFGAHYRTATLPVLYTVLADMGA